MIEIVKELVKYLESNDASDADVSLNEIEKAVAGDLSELIKYSDDDIKDSIEELIENKEYQQRAKDIINRIKMEQSIKKYADENETEKRDEEKSYLLELFSEVAAPDEIIIDNGKVKLEYSYCDSDELRKKVNGIRKWKIDNARETISKELGIPIENITVIKSVSEYVEFIASLDCEYNYVSRGQKDCTFELKPSLHRIYSGEYAIHSAILETEFKRV